MKMLFDPSTMEVVQDGVKHAIVKIKTGHVAVNVISGLYKAGDPIFQYGVLVKKGNYIHGCKTYVCGPNEESHGSFVQDRFYKLEGNYEQKRLEGLEKFLKGNL